MYDSTSTVSIAISYEDNISEQAAKALEQEAQYIKTLQNPYLIGEILNEVQKTIVGEEDTIISLSIQTCTRKVKNSSPESKNIIVNGKSGVGKDAIVTAVCEVMMNDEDYIHKTKLTPEVFTYWHTNDPDWNWDGRVLHIEDPTTELINSQTFKTQASGVKSDVVVKDQKVIEPEHYGKPNMIITTFEGNADVEGIRRWPSITLDTSDEQTKNVLKYISQINSKKKKTEPNHLLRDALHRLIPYNVVIPFANQIDEHFPKTVLMRTYYKRFLDYIKASTVLYQRQREKDDDGYLIATREDYELGRLAFMKTISNVAMIPLNSDQQLLLDTLKEENRPMFVSELMKEIPRGKNWMYTNLGILKRYGLIKVGEAPKEDANKKVATFQYVTELSDVDIPNWSFLVVSNEQTTELMEKNDEKDWLFGCLQTLKEIDEKRIKMGLAPKYKHYYGKLLYFLNNQENQTTNHITTIDNQQTTTNNQSMIISEKLNDLKDFIKRNKDAGYTISYEMLTHKYNDSFIDQCINQNLLCKNAKNEYEFNEVI